MIGTSRGNLMATEPVGTFGVIGTVVSSLPEGDIHVSVRTVGLDATGANLGGTETLEGLLAKTPALDSRNWLEGPPSSLTKA